MDITYSNSICVDDYNYLRKSVGWKEVDDQQVIKGLENSAYLITAKYGQKTVGMARVISDGGYFYFVVDVAVIPEYQCFGIGRELMEKVMKFINDSIKPGETANVSLMSMPDKEFFYEKFGFVLRPNENYGHGMTNYVQKLG